MARYLLFLVLGLTLGFFILIGAPKNSVLTDMLGLLIMSVGTGKFLTNRRTAGFMAVIGLAMISHVIAALWFNFLVLEQDLYVIQALILYGGLTLTILTLATFALYSALAETVNESKLDRIALTTTWTKILQTMPILLMLIEIGFGSVYLIN